MLNTSLTWKIDMFRHGLIGGRLGYSLLHYIRPDGGESGNGPRRGGCRETKSLEDIFGSRIWSTINRKTVLLSGCGIETAVIETARNGARKVIVADTRCRSLQGMADRVRKAGLEDRCEFIHDVRAETVDVIISVDGLEQYNRPGRILEELWRLLRPGGRALISCGPPRFHPYGGHLFSVFPWAHLLFTEEALLRWCSDFKSDCTIRFQEVEEGFNFMTIRRLRHLVDSSPFHIEAFEAVPIRGMHWLSTPLTREFVTSAARCELVRGD